MRTYISNIWLLLAICLYYVSDVSAKNSPQDSIDLLIKNESDPFRILELHISGIEELDLESKADIDSYFIPAFKLANELGQSNLSMKLLHGAGRKLFEINEEQAAQEKFEQLNNLALQEKDLPFQAKAKIGFARLLRKENKLEEAKQFLLQSTSLAESSGAYMIKANALKMLAMISRTEGKAKEAISFLDQCETALAKEMHIPTYLELLNLRGRVYRSTGNLDSARITYIKAIQIALDENEEGSLSRAYNNLGNIYQLEGNYEEALGYYVKSLEIKEKQKNKKGIALAHYNIGTIKISMKDYIGSISNFIKSQKMAQEIDYAKVVQLNELKIGNAYHEMQQLDSAIIYHNRSLKMAQEAKDKNGVALCYLNLGQDYTNLREYGTAFKYMQDALNIAKETGNRSYEAGALSSIASTYLESMNHQKETGEVQLESIQLSDQEIEAYLMKSKEIALETGNSENLEISLVGLSHLFAKTKNHEARAKALDEYVALKDTMFSSERTRAIADWETKYETAEKEKEITILEAAEEKSKARIKFWSIISILLLLIVGAGSYLYRQLQKVKRKLVVQNDQLIELNQTKDRFFGIIAHDIRSPIIALESVDEQMDYYLKKDNISKLTELSGLVGRTARHLNSLLDNLLNWALVQTNGMPYKPEKIKVSQVFQEVSDLVDGNLKMKNITLEKHLPPDLVIIADSASFNTVLRNLISNAIKFSHPEGKIVLSAEKVNSNTLFSVKDQGVGIDPEKLEVLFTLNKKSNKGTAGEKGTGLGLILCKELVELNKGEILVESEFGKGSTFSFTIPNVSN